MKFLVDANVLSEPTKPDPDPLVDRWLSIHVRDLAINPIILGEMKFGILKMPQGAKRTRLLKWFDSGIMKITCLPWDSESGLFWADLVARLHKAGRPMPVKDSLIATTALLHNLSVVTRNEADFAHCGVRVINPFRR